MFKLSDRVKQISTTTGTNDIVFASELAGFQTFSQGIGDANSTYYAIENHDRFEIGIGTYTSSTNTLSRDTVLISNNSNNKIILDGVSSVFVTYPAAKSVNLDSSGFITSFEAEYAGIKFPDGTTQETSANTNRSHTTINSDTTLITTNEVVLISSLSFDIEVTLPLASSMEGKTVSFKFNSNTNKCTILSQSTESIDGSSFTVIRYKNESISCFSDGEDWYIL